MTKDEAINYYGSQVALAAALKINQSNISDWPAIPDLRQIQLERLTNGALKADPECWVPRDDKRKAKAEAGSAA